MIQINLAKAKSSFSEYARRAAYTDEHIVITKRGKPFVALISVKDLEFLERIKAGSPEDGLLGAAGIEPELEDLAEETMEVYHRRSEDFGRKVNL